MLISTLQMKEAIQYRTESSRFQEIEYETVECDEGIETIESILYDTVDKKYYSVLHKCDVYGEYDFWEQDAPEVEKKEITVTKWVPINKQI